MDLMKTPKVSPSRTSKIPPERLQEMQQTAYEMDPDFGNRGKEQKAAVIEKVLDSMNENFASYPPDKRKVAAQGILKQIGEESSYGAGELAYDMGVPAAGEALGGLLGGKPGAVVGGGVAATAGEAG